MAVADVLAVVDSIERRDHLHEQLPAETFEEGQLMMATRRNFWQTIETVGLMAKFRQDIAMAEPPTSGPGWQLISN